MTEEYKKRLLEYFMGEIPETYGDDTEEFKSKEEIPFSKWEPFLPKTWQKLIVEGIVEVKNTDLTVLYGGYRKRESNIVEGFIILADKNLNPIKTFYEWEGSSEKLRYIQCMMQDEAGDFVALDSPEIPSYKDKSFITSKKRFLMFNNFASEINGYKLKLRKSYIMQYTNLYCKQIYKNPSSAHYTFVGSELVGPESSLDFDLTRIIELKINVGAKNEWFNYRTTKDFIYGGAIAKYNENDECLVRALISSSKVESDEITCWTKNYDGKLIYKSIYKNENEAIIDVTMNDQCVWMNENEAYYILNNQHWGIDGKPKAKGIKLCYYNYAKNESKTMYEKNFGDYDFCDFENLYIANNNNELYITLVDNIDKTNKTADYYYGRKNKTSDLLTKNDLQLIGKAKKYNNRYVKLYINNSFNLLNTFIFLDNIGDKFFYMVNLKENYNKFNYNGKPYLSKKCLNPYSGEIYSNDNFVFARDLYNKTLTDSTTVSTLEIPNNYLNDINLTSKKLLSETNLVMNDDLTPITKNVYENLRINFINTILMKNQNDPKNEILNPAGAKRLNDSIGQNFDIEEQKIGKYKINYKDGTSLIQELYAVKNGDNIRQCKFYLYIGKEIEDLQLISNDEQTIYLTINCEELEVGKNYKIEQEVKIK